jgi:outer membrane protein OmpA-like peptidoglycan-associated protein
LAEGTEAAPEGEAETAGTDPNEFALNDSDSAGDAQGVSESKIKPSKTEAAMKFIVVDKEKGPIPGIVVSLTAPNGKTYYTPATDAKGYAEVLVPVGQKYELVYLSLGRKDVAAKVPVTDEPNQNIKLTLRYKRWEAQEEATPRFVLRGVEFDTGKATIRKDSLPRLDDVVEFMMAKKDSKIEISGHTDNVGNQKSNKVLSQKRAEACRDYLISKGIDGGRIKAIGHGDEKPIAPNDTVEGRQKNRRIEAKEQ